MKKIFTLLSVIIFFYSCKNLKEKIKFASLDQNEFNSQSFAITKTKEGDSLKHAHDSCMGFSFDANAILIRTKDNAFVGNIINKRTLKTVNTVRDLGIPPDQLMNSSNILTNPCYEKRTMLISIRSLFGENFNIQLPGSNNIITKELNDDLLVAQNTEIQSGSWVYLDMKDVLPDILDTAKNAMAMVYKKNLLDTNNVVLIAIESITNVSFLIHTKTAISDELQNLLRQKLRVLLEDKRSSIRFSAIDDTSFQIGLDGFFPVAGQYMKAE